MRFDDFYFHENITIPNITQWIKSSFRKIVNSIKKLFSMLNFGQTKRISLGVSNNMKESNGEDRKSDLKSRIGYYVERVTAYNLCKNLLDSGFKIKSKNLLEELNNEMNRYRTEKIENVKWGEKEQKNLSGKIRTSEQQGEALAEKIFTEISSSEDSALCLFDIELAGESRKFETTADLIVTKMSEQKVVQEIFASLKAYSGFSINLVNSTFISFIKKVMFPNVEGTGAKFVKNLLDKIEDDELSTEAKDVIRRIPEISKLASEFSKLKRSLKKKKVPDYSTLATEFMNQPMEEGGKSRYQIIRDFVIDIFNEVYKDNGDRINESFVNSIGLGSEEIYLAVTQSNNTRVISTKTSKGFKKLVDNFNDKFYMRMEKISEKTNSFSLVFYGNNDVEFLRLKIPIKEEGKLNLWMDFKPFFVE